MSEENAIDSAIATIQGYISDNQIASKRLLSYLMLFSLFVLTFVMMLFVMPLSIKAPDTLLYGIFAMFIIVFGVLMAVYRFHLNEISRSEHYKMGFLRVRVAANNHNLEGFKTEVRQALTDGAFAYTATSLIGSKDKKVESPLPGHPTSDISVILLNKLLEGMEPKKR